MMRRTLIIITITALSVLPLLSEAQMSGTQPRGGSYEEQQTERRLIPEGAHPSEPSGQPSIGGAQPQGGIPEGRSTEGYLIPKGAHPGQPSSEAMPDRSLVRDTQVALRDAGFDPGRIDGVMGPRTQAALREFQASQGLPQTGRLDPTTQKQLSSVHMPQSGGRGEAPPSTFRDPSSRDPARPGSTTPGASGTSVGR
jgi:hypothetical protein